MRPKIQIRVSERGEILVHTEEMVEGEWCVFDETRSLKIAHEVIANQTRTPADEQRSEDVAHG